MTQFFQKWSKKFFKLFFPQLSIETQHAEETFNIKTNMYTFYLNIISFSSLASFLSYTEASSQDNVDRHLHKKRLQIYIYILYCIILIIQPIYLNTTNYSFRFVLSKIFCYKINIVLEFLCSLRHYYISFTLHKKRREFQ